MDAMLHRHCARYIYVVPEGLRELMSDISREVLRSQPKDVYTFIADYLDALMITRENARVAARLVESLTELATTTAMFLEETGMPRNEIENIVHAIQKTFRKSIDPDREEEDSDTVSEDVEEEAVITNIMNEIEVSPGQAQIAARIIQQAYRRFKERKEREKLLLAGMIDWRAAARSAIHLYRRTGVTNEEANRAATLIKAAYKGYYTRKIMRSDVAREQYELMKNYIDTDYELFNYLIYSDGDRFVDDEEYYSDDKAGRAVTLDYRTIIPHVAFDTQDSFLSSHGGTIDSIRMSTTSSIVKHSLNYLFYNVAEQISTQSTIIEENSSDFKQESRNILIALPDETKTPVEMEIMQENLDIAGSSEISNTDSAQKEP